METNEQDQDQGKKCYVLMLQSHFPSKHPRNGSRTLFEPLVQRGVKIHGFMHDYEEYEYEKWRQIAEELDAGTAYVSIRIWANKRGNSPQREVKRLYRIGVQSAQACVQDDSLCLVIDSKKHQAPWCVASSDGMCHSDLQEWLCPDGKPWSGCLVHFTDMRY